MNSRWANLVAAFLVAFASLVITWQIRHYNRVEKGPYESLALSFRRVNKLAKITNIVARDGEYIPASGTCRYYDSVLPNNARVFMTDMIGTTNNNIGLFFCMTYYLFPREIGTSLDHKTRLIINGFLGQTSESDQEILTHGFDVRCDYLSGDRVSLKALRDLPLKIPTRPAWFNSNSDTAMAFLLPLLTALAGMWLFRFLFPILSKQMPLLEQLAYSLGLGMMAVAALTLGVKLCGFSGRGLIFSVTAVGGIAEIWRNRKLYLTGIIGGCRKTVCSPGRSAVFVSGLFVFLILFRRAGLQGIAEFDAIMSWLLKAKVMHLYNGRELVQWFSNPRLTGAHLDYPALVPSLHSATYDSIGHVDEFVTKFWPAWMLLFLIAALASLTRAGNNWRHVSSFALLGLLLSPFLQVFVQYEGSAMPMIFFTVPGFVQCALWLAGKDRARLGLGLTFLFGGAMTHFAGVIFLALVGSWMLLLPSARPSLKLSPPFWRILAFCFLAALPYACLRVQIPSLNIESDWAGYALHHPGNMLSNWPGLFMLLLAGGFLSSDFAHWSGDGGQFHWIGRWDGLSSLYNHQTLGLTWICLLLTVALWFAIPARRQVIIWTLAMLIGSLVAFSGVFASFVNITSTLTQIVNYVKDDVAGRYLMPMLLAWFATLMTLFFAEPPSTPAADRRLPALKHGYWLAIGALLIMAFGVFVLPKNESTLPANPLPVAAAASSLNGSETNSPENPDSDLQARMELAIQLDKAGKFAEALQVDRESVRLHPNNPLALNNLALNLAANPRQELRNGREAVQLASKAVELTGRQDPVFIGTLAAAYAEDGQFAKAVEMAKKARDTALSKGQPEVAAINDQLLKLFSAGKAIRSTNRP
jgi:hypothetical protein